MQKLQFEEKWDKAIAKKDRKRIEQIFSELDLTNNSGIQLTRLSQAQNYRGELLVMVLIHNTSDQILNFDGTKLHYIENNEILANHTFTLPSLVIEPKTSMPWTFIFPVETIQPHVSLENGYLELIRS
ncbi:SLAP domain-containing protein [Aquibacillus halophilus]|uniref:SLAP domain-containing protein n=1 Tax=Aquibacillus halophilus TaxID=930132 RepID=A0A6A8DMM3_9BACI|nr:SLAP domain-containing protein [Aquibacillus halophilus]MRH45061.1 SLAP domain-containing protein [Aquibacillus halophilus]